MTRDGVTGQGIRYLLIGAYNTLFTLAVFGLFDWLWGQTLGVQTVYWAAAGLGIVNGFISQRLIVWRARGEWRRQFLKFFVVNLLVAMVNSALLFVTVTLWDLPAFPAQVGITAVLVIASFFVNRRWVFAAHTPRVPEEE